MPDATQHPNARPIRLFVVGHHLPPIFSDPMALNLE